ncbi:MAG: rod shape-determining protein MreD [Candidatus Omnitrophica bacterium]|nr:rod shape-determining protein MreD [Candidatus Omnitrophota bacterium]
MKNLRFFLIIVAAAVLQSSVVDYFRVFRVSPDLLLICVVLASLHAGWRGALALSFLGGVLKDCLGLNPAGFYTVLFPLIGFITVKLSRDLAIDNGPFGALFIFVVAFICDICIMISLGFLGTVVSRGIMFRILAVEPLYTAGFFLLVCGVLKPLLHPFSAKSYL